MKAIGWSLLVLLSPLIFAFILMAYAVALVAEINNNNNNNNKKEGETK